MEKLTQELDRLIKTLPNEDTFRQKLENLSSVYPFSEYEYVISALLSAERLTFDGYVELRDDYITRNRFLHILDIERVHTIEINRPGRLDLYFDFPVKEKIILAGVALIVFFVWLH